ncbi:MAG: hypothetical protein E7570_03815 [Ruminococcaceae bacterium]|nr:hypothetical protein [Oscillospiraceae bacterium]
MNKTKKLIALLLSILMLVSVLPIGSFSAMANSEQAAVTVSNVTATPGSTVSVDVKIANNPGILGAVFTLRYDENLTLVNATSGDAFSALAMTKPGRFQSPCQFTWDGIELSDSDIKDGTILTLEFQVSEEAEDDSQCEVELTYNNGDIVDSNLNAVSLSITNGSVKVIDFIYGDANGDMNVNIMDVILIRRFIAGGYDVTINENAANVNGDTRINMTDVIYIRRFIAGGWDVELPVAPAHTHDLEKIERVEATCTEDGHIACWHCKSCNKFYRDESCATEISVENTVIEATGHTVVIDEAVAPTYTSTGLTEGSHCSECETIIVPQVVIPMLQKNEYAINYYITNNDVYLESLEIENPNPSAYTKEDGLTLRNLSVPGYIFEGWYDGEGANAEIIKKIPAGTTGEVDLYAKWTPVKYNISFDNTGLFAVPSETYQINQDKILPTPKLSGYVFVGWSDEDGEILSTIPAGSTYGHKTYTANWISERNKAETFTKIAEPTVYEDDERILYTYYIGKINNVPVSVINDFGYINEDGISKTVTKRFTKTVDDTQMKTLTNTVKKETTNSFGWTLSDSWNEGTTIDEGWLQKTGKSRTEVEEISRNESSNWYVSSGTSGSNTISSMNSSDSYNNNSSEYNVNTRNRNQYSTDDTVSAELKTTVSAEVGAGYGPFSAKVGTSVESGTSAVSNVKTDRLSDVKTNNTVSNNNGTANHSETSSSSTSGWNTESGRGGSSSTTKSNSVSETVSTECSKNYNLQTSYLKSNTQSETQGHEDSSSNQDEYSSAVTYSTVIGEEIEETFTTTNTKTGYHRWILAGTAHVFGQVGYDIASGEYFVSTFTMMDDKVHQFEDYSYKTADYNDFENTVIKFEAPMDIAECVNNRICESEGLEVSKSGKVTRYTGSDKNVIIPEYKVFDNQDGTKTVVKVTSIGENVFAGNENIETVEVSNFVTEIPDGAFENCTSLTHINALGVTKIGDSAFAGCTSIEELQVCEQVTELGENVVSNETRLYVEATNKSVVEAAVNSNAKVIAISILDECNDLENTTLEVPSTTEKLLINGFGKTFNNLKIKSDAQKTVFNRVNFNTTGSIPIIISSENVELHEVSISSSGIGLALTSVLTNLSLRGNCYINSSNENSILCKNISTNQIDSSLTTVLQVSGKILTCGGISENISLISYKDNSIEIIDQETFDKYLNGHFVVTFDAGEGTVSETTRDLFYGDEIGELPEPTRDYYRFDGWYAPNGDKITENTEFASPDDVTLTARWTQNDVKGWVLESEAPIDAEIVDTKYTYTLRSYTTSGSSSMSGWTKYNTTSAWGSYGNWSGWSTTKYTASDSRQVESRSVYDHTEYHYYRWVNGSTVYTYQQSSSLHLEEQWFTYVLPRSTKTNDADFGYYGSDTYANRWIKASSSYNHSVSTTWSRDVNRTEYRYRDRAKVYTYYYYQDNAKESATDPTGTENISNVQKWVQYREK